MEENEKLHNFFRLIYNGETKLMTSHPLQKLRMISFVEGVSYLLLLCIGMPLKYGLGIRSVNYVLGMGHGVLTMLFVLLLMMAYADKKLTLSQSIQVFIASMIPLGAFWAEKQFQIWMNQDPSQSPSQSP